MTNPVTGKLVGAGVKRVEDPRFLLGQGRYVGDFKVHGLVELAILRSPHAHARVRSIDVSQAAAMPGVLAVYTWKDLEGFVRPLRATLDPVKNPTYKPCDWYPLAHDKVRYVGEAVAMVVATSRYVAEDALDLIEVDYEPLPVIADMEKALEPGSALVHDEWGDNVLCSTDYATGDVEGAFARAHKVVKQRFRSNRHHALPLEPRGCIATIEPAMGNLTLYTSSQMPHMVRSKLAEHLNHPENQIRVVAPDVGGGFGLKCHLFPEEALTTIAAMRLKRPVRWIEDRRESFLTSFHAKDEMIEGELALDANGEILAARLYALADVGAYSAYPWTSAFEVLHAVQMFPGPYRMRNFAFRALSVATNKSTLSTYRGVGAPMATFVMEGLLDLGARELGLDPVEIRRRNLIRNEEFPYLSVTGMNYEPGGYLECLEQAVSRSDYASFREEQRRLREKGIYRGIGVACYNEITALGSRYWHAIGVPMSAFESANVKMDPAGRVTLTCGTHSHGQGHETIYAQMAADELGVPIEHVTVRLGDTAETPYGWGTWGSRAAVTGGGAVINASKKLAEKIKRVAAHLLEVGAADVELGGGKATVRGVPQKSIALADLAKQAVFTAAAEIPAGLEPGLDETAYYEPPPVTFPNATHVAIVEVDRATGALKILRYVVAEDCGRVINPVLLDGQIVGGIAQGLGGAIFEHLVYDENGQLLTTSFMDYLIPSAADVPFVEISHHETYNHLVPGGFKGAGEGGAIPPMAAIANAISDALSPFGVCANQLPLSPERVFRLSNEAA